MVQDTQEKEQDTEHKGHVLTEKECACQLQRIESLTDELKDLLAHDADAIDKDIRREISVLERWIDCYCQGLVGAPTVSETSTVLLSNLRDRLKLAADELLRLESEGGSVADRRQAETTEELLKAVRHIERVIHPPI